MVSAASIGAVTAPVIGLLSDRFGRKPLLIFAAVPIIINWIITIMATSPGLIILARAIGGIGTASIYVLGPLYVGEVAHENNRGMLGSMLDLFGNSGFLFSYCVGPYTSIVLFNCLCCSFPVMFLLFVIFIPETPLHLLRKKKPACAIVSLARLRHKSQRDIQ
ncbi:hypothetical protein L9F63_013212, partial [Diploptera punctata]